MAREAGRALLRREAASVAHDGDGRSRHRHLQSDGRRRYGLHPRTFRRRQDRAPARHFQAGRRRHHHHGGLRRARQRGGRNLQGVPRTGRSPYGPQAHGAYDHHLQYVEHARCGARGVGLYRHGHRRILPLDGTQGAGDGRLDFALGAGAARDVEPSGGAARSGRLPDGPFGDHLQLLFARRSGQTEQRPDGFRDLPRYGVACGR